MTAKAPQRRQVRIGTLWAVVGLLLASGFLRLLITAGPVMAIPAAPSVVEPVGPLDQCSATETPQALIDALRQREERNDLREAQISDRMQALSVAEREIAEQIMALEAAETSLAELLSLANSAAEDDLNRLTQVYENMKPSDAAALFETMEPGFSAGFMGRMRPEAAAAIMTNLAPETAYLISVVLAGRNANAPTQ